MIKVIPGNLFDSEAQILAHQVNCKGVMGSGVAKEVNIHTFLVSIGKILRLEN